MAQELPIDFFISYTKADRAWAEWVAWQLEDMGYHVRIDVWDFKAGQNFVNEMQKASLGAKRTIAILSPDYFKSSYTAAEWTAAFADDATGEQRKLIPIKVKPVDTGGYFKTTIFIDLIGLTKVEAQKRLQEQIKVSEDGSRAKPFAEPVFPPDHVNRKGLELETSPQDKTSPKIAGIFKTTGKENTPEFKAGLVDKFPQASHIFNVLDRNFFIDESDKIVPATGFLLYGAASQWPDALLYILYNGIRKNINRRHASNSRPILPELKIVNEPVYRTVVSPKEYLYELIVSGLDVVCEAEEQQIIEVLAKKESPFIFFRPLKSTETNNPILIRGMLESWHEMRFPIHSPRHLLIFFYEHSVKPCPIWLRWFSKKDTSLEKIKKSLPESLKTVGLLPEISSPKRTDIEEWVNLNFRPDITQEVKDFICEGIKAEYEKRRKDKKMSKEKINRIQIVDDDISIHHYDLKNFLVVALQRFS